MFSVEKQEQYQYFYAEKKSALSGAKHIDPKCCDRPVPRALTQIRRRVSAYSLSLIQWFYDTSRENGLAEILEELYGYAR